MNLSLAVMVEDSDEELAEDCDLVSDIADVPDAVNRSALFPDWELSELVFVEGPEDKTSILRATNSVAIKDF